MIVATASSATERSNSGTAAPATEIVPTAVIATERENIAFRPDAEMLAVALSAAERLCDGAALLAMSPTALSATERFTTPGIRFRRRP